MMKEVCGVYSWTHVLTGKKYVGSSFHCRKRKSAHLRAFKNGKNGHFNCQVRKLGADNFVYEIIEICERDSLRIRETFWISELNSVIPNGFNIQKNPSAQWNCEHTEEMRSALSVARKAFVNSQIGLEHRANHSCLMSKPVMRFSITGEYIATHRSIKSAADFVSVRGPSICIAIKHGGTSGGFRWKHKSDKRPLIMGRHIGSNHNPVKQISDCGQIIKTHPSAKAAALSLGVTRNSIRQAIVRKSKSCGFRWELA